jgi:hypothetical protein
MPPELDVTVPAPVPGLLTVTVYWARLKVAVTVVAAVTLTTQVLVPEQGPDHPWNVEPVVGVAVKVTDVPEV